ncbi:hypothetical protein JKP88DRAFT_241047 [Tribonema minus]|uniref:Uncharacterized protein n=1 Tax=Tribonema minus TaxID=303371 RepID=A0A835ZA96_9STRA|nr:hypothetical protein JKP88DRAFT_241047 [Tribonema minus]
MAQKSLQALGFTLHCALYDVAALKRHTCSVPSKHLLLIDQVRQSTAVLVWHAPHLLDADTLAWSRAECRVVDGAVHLEEHVQKHLRVLAVLLARFVVVLIIAQPPDIELRCGDPV